MANKERMEVRVEAEVLRSLKGLAEDAGISLNQLMSGVARWASSTGRAGRPMGDGNLIETIDQPGIVWFGCDGREEDDQGRVTGQAEVHLVIDYSESNAVRPGSVYLEK